KARPPARSSRAALQFASGVHSRVSSVKNSIKKAGQRPLPELPPGSPGAKSCSVRLAPEWRSGHLRRHGCSDPPSARLRLLRGGGRRSGAVAVDAVVATAWLHTGSQRQRTTRFGV